MRDRTEQHADRAAACMVRKLRSPQSTRSQRRVPESRAGPTTFTHSQLADLPTGLKTRAMRHVLSGNTPNHLISFVHSWSRRAARGAPQSSDNASERSVGPWGIRRTAVTRLPSIRLAAKHGLDAAVQIKAGQPPPEPHMHADLQRHHPAAAGNQPAAVVACCARRCARPPPALRSASTA